jgi:hypothetical protein
MFVIALFLVVLSLLNALMMFTITGKATGTVGITVLAPPGPTFVSYSCGDLSVSHGGWNFVSSPVVLPNNSVRAALSSIEGNYSSVYEFNTSSNSWLDFDNVSDSGTLPGIYPSGCYVIKAAAVDELVFNGTSYHNSISKGLLKVYDRWNFFGWVHQTTARDTALASVSNKYDWIFRYDGATGRWDYYYAPFSIGNLAGFSACDCVMIKPTVNATLSYSV